MSGRAETSGEQAMTDLQYDILDELYFVQPFEYIVKSTDISENIVKKELLLMIEKGWVKCFDHQQEEVWDVLTSFDTNFFQYKYLASKAGLLAHNSK